MKLCFMLLIILCGFKSLARENENPYCYFDTDDTSIKRRIENQIGNFIYSRIEAHLRPHKIYLRKETLTTTLYAFKEAPLISGGYEYEPRLSVETNSNQKLVVRYDTSYFVGQIRATHWRPDGSAKDAKCYMVHFRFDEADPFTVENFKTNKVILKISPKEIPPLPIYNYLELVR